MVSIDGMDMLCPPEPNVDKLTAKLEHVAQLLDKQQPKLAELIRQAIQVIQTDEHKIEHLIRTNAAMDDGEEWD